MNGGRPGISVIVPTHNRVESLERCLARLAAQETSEPVEIIVVDDGSDVAEQVAGVVARTPGARLLRQARHWPAAARNAGVGAAVGSVVCFTDDDCEPDPNWVRRLADAVRSGADVAAGTTTNGKPGSWFARAAHVQVEHF